VKIGGFPGEIPFNILKKNKKSPSGLEGRNFRVKMFLLGRILMPQTESMFQRGVWKSKAPSKISCRGKKTEDVVGETEGFFGERPDLNKKDGPGGACL